jgi:predicted protein tyrosine phosphatase
MAIWFAVTLQFAALAAAMADSESAVRLRIGSYTVTPTLRCEDLGDFFASRASRILGAILESRAP